MHGGNSIRSGIARIFLMLLISLLAACGEDGFTTSGSDAVDSIELTTGAEALTANGQEVVAIRATLTGIDGIAMRDRTVEFETTLGHFENEDGTASARTNSQGIAQIGLVSAERAGTATITARSGGVLQTTTVDFTAGPVATPGLTMTADDQVIAVNESTELRVVLMDQNKNPVSGETVIFNFANNQSGATLSVTSAQTDDNGEASVTVTGGEETGTDRILARVASNNVINAEINIDVLNMFDGRLSLAANPAAIVADDQSQTSLTATWLDVTQLPVSGEVVRIIESAEEIQQEFEGTGNGVTDTFTAAGGPSTFTIGLTGGAGASPEGVPFVVSIHEADSDEPGIILFNEVVATGTLPLTEQQVTLDQGARYFFQVQASSGNWTIEAADGVIQAPQETEVGRGETNADGQFSIEVAGRTEAGSATFQVVPVAGESPTPEQSMATVRFLAGEPGSQSLSATTPIFANGVNKSTIQAVLLDTHGNLVEDGVQVNFMTSGGTLSNTSATTLDGVASTELIAPSEPQAVTVTSTLSDSEIPDAQTTVDFIGASLTPIEVTEGGDVGTIGNEQAKTLNIRLRDERGVAIEGETITFTSTSGTLSQRQVTTGPNGFASVSFVADFEENSTITASYGEITRSVNITRTVIAAGRIVNNILLFMPDQVAAGETFTFSASLFDENNNPVPNERVALRVQDQNGRNLFSQDNLEADDNGVISGITLPPSSIAPADFYDGVSRLEVSLNTSDEVGATGLIDVLGTADAAARIVLFLPDQVTAGENFTLSASIFDENNNPVANERASLRVQDQTGRNLFSQDNLQADENGVISGITLPPSSISPAEFYAGVTSLAISLRIAEGTGETGLINVIGSTAARINAFVPSEVDAGSTFPVSASVLDDNDDPIEGESVTVRVSDQASNELFSTRQESDADGIISGISIPPGSVTPADFYAGVTSLRITFEASNGASTSERVTVNPGDAEADDITLLVSRPMLASGGGDEVELSALARDVNDNLIAGIEVTFAVQSGSNGAIQVTQGTTNASGVAQAVLTTGGDPTPRTIDLRASASGVADSNQVEVVGTVLNINGPNTLALDSEATLDLRLEDSEGGGIANELIDVSTESGSLSIGTSSLTTGTDGRVALTVTGESVGDDVVNVSAFGGTVQNALNIEITSESFAFIEPSSDLPEIGLNDSQTVRLEWAEVTPVNGQVQFTTTRGTISGGDLADGTIDQTDDDGIAQVTIEADNAGRAIVSATSIQKDGNPIPEEERLSAQLEVLFVAEVPAVVDAQAIPTTIATGGDQSVIEARVRDNDGNPVKNQRVDFNLVDISSGTLSNGSAITDELGLATTTYTSSDLGSGFENVTVNVDVGDIPGTPDDVVNLTVSEREVFIVFGTGREIEILDLTRYRKPYAALVTDIAGNGIADHPVEGVILPIRYRKGYWIQSFTPEGEFDQWVSRVTATCPNEDLNNNGILEEDLNEDINDSGRLEPGNVVAIPSSLITDDEGFVTEETLGITYPKDRARWVTVEMQLRTEVDGSEFANSVSFELPIAAEDVTEEDSPPPVNPYGSAVDCTCSIADELAAENAGNTADLCYPCPGGDLCP